MDLLALNSLPSELREAIAFQELAAGQTLFQQGDVASAVFVVRTGRIRLMRYINEDKLVTFQVARPGESLAEIALFSDTYPCTAIAEVASRAIAYPKQALLSALRNHPDLAEDFMAMLLRKIQELKFRIELRDIRAARERVLRYLRDLAQAQTTVTLDRPLKDIAADLDFTPETLSRTLTRLEREGVITRRRLQITLHDSSAA